MTEATLSGKEKVQRVSDLTFYKTISQISQRFVATRSEAYDSDINDMLYRIGTHFTVNRSYLFLFENDDTNVRNTHEWCAESIEPQISNLQDLPTDC